MANATISTPLKELNITRILNAPRELVWRAWTDCEHLAKWWGPLHFSNPECEMDVRPGGALRIVMQGPDGNGHPMTGEFVEVVPPERLVFSAFAFFDENGEPQLETLNTITFTEQAGKTTMMLRAAVLKAGPMTAAGLAGMDEGWSQSLDLLDELVAPQRGTVIVERTFQATNEQVWHALTNRDAMNKWYFQLEAFEPRVGFEFQFTGEKDGFTYLHNCKVTEVIPGRKIAYSWSYEGYEGSSEASFELIPAGNGTRLRLVHTGIDTFPALPAFDRSNFNEGWTWLIGHSLRDFLSTN